MSGNYVSATATDSTGGIGTDELISTSTTGSCSTAGEAFGGNLLAQARLCGLDARHRQHQACVGFGTAAATRTAMVGGGRATAWLLLGSLLNPVDPFHQHWLLFLSTPDRLWLAPTLMVGMSASNGLTSSSKATPSVMPSVLLLTMMAALMTTPSGKLLLDACHRQHHDHSRHHLSAS